MVACSSDRYTESRDKLILYWILAFAGSQWSVLSGAIALACLDKSGCMMLCELKFSHFVVRDTSKKRFTVGYPRDTERNDQTRQTENEIQQISESEEHVKSHSKPLKIWEDNWHRSFCFLEFPWPWIKVKVTKTSIKMSVQQYLSLDQVWTKSVNKCPNVCKR